MTSILIVYLLCGCQPETDQIATDNEALGVMIHYEGEGIRYLTIEESYSLAYEILDAQKISSIPEAMWDRADFNIYMVPKGFEENEKQLNYRAIEGEKYNHYYLVNREKDIMYTLHPYYAPVMKSIFDDLKEKESTDARLNLDD